MLQKMYDKVIALSASKHALPALAAVSFAESSVFPIPPDLLLVPMALAQPHKARLYALVCTIASVVGGMLGYAIGALLYDTLGQWLIKAYGYGEGMEAFRAAYDQWGAWIILIKGLTPIPYKIETIASGFAGARHAVQGWGRVQDRPEPRPQSVRGRARCPSVRSLTCA